MPIVKTIPEVAQHLGRSVKTIGNWKREPGFPLQTDGQYDTDAIKAWAETRFGEDESERDQKREIRDLEIRERKVRLEERELALAIRRQEYHPTALTIELITIVFTRIRDAHANLVKAGNLTGAETVLEQLDAAQRQIEERLDREHG